MHHRWLWGLLTALPAIATAGEIFGTLAEDGRPLADTRIDIAVAGKIYSTQTDSQGAYRIFVAESGRAILSVGAGPQAPAIDVFSSERAVRYDLNLERKTGQLKRR